MDLTSQMRRAAVAIPSDTAEGKGRQTDRDRTHFYLQARGSPLELETQMIIAKEVNYISGANQRRCYVPPKRSGKCLNGLVQAIRPYAAEVREAPDA